MKELPRKHCSRNTMKRRSVSASLCAFALLSQFTVRTLCASADEEVKIEVVFKPLECSQKSKKGDLMNVHYDGFLQDGSQFYCSRSDKAGHPQWFVVGVGQVIKGLDMGLLDMCPGERRKITVPPALAFGEKGKAPVPPNATVLFEVEALAVSRGPRSMEAFSQMDANKDKSLTKEEVKEYLKHDYTKAGNPRDEPFYERIMEDIFMKTDHNKDGQISAKEYNIYEHDEL